jgi:hypothetical protein
MATILHDSDCAVHNAPALPIGQCDCGADRLIKIDQNDTTPATGYRRAATWIFGIAWLALAIYLLQVNVLSKIGG